MNKLKVGVIGSSHPHAGMLYNTLAVLGDCVEFVGYSDVVTDGTEADFRKSHKPYYGTFPPNLSHCFQ